MARTLSDRLSEAARCAFVGREAEVRSLCDEVQMHRATIVNLTP